MDLLLIAIDASLKAGKEIMQIYNSDDFEISLKADNSPLTKADSKSNSVIIEKLSETSIPVLSEESKEIDYDLRKNWSRLWIVDPLDGTKEFIKRNGEFTVNIALVENGIPVLGVIYAPVSGELFYSEKSKASFKSIVNGELNTQNLFNLSEKLPYSQEKDKDTYTLVVSRSHMNQETEEFVRRIEKDKGEIDTISRGSSLKICMVAEGKAECYPRFAPTMEWDTAAGHAIAKYAGKSVVSVETGKELTYNKENLTNPGFIVQ